ncbi:MAG: YoaK family protein [Microbacteriaceae bacterium]
MSLLLLTFATGLVDAVSVLVLGHVFVANMTGNVIFLGFWLVPHSGVDLWAALVAFVSFLTGAVIGGRLVRHLGPSERRWLTVALSVEVLLLVVLAGLAGAGVLRVGIGFDSRLAGGTGQREKLRCAVVLTMCAGAVVGATMTLYTVAPVIGLAAAVVTVVMLTFAFGPALVGRGIV